MPSAQSILSAGLIALAASLPAFASTAPPFVCGGAVEDEAWATWDAAAERIVRKELILDRLQKQGDVYALYDFQIFVHNLASMAQRCNRTARLLALAQLIKDAYASLEPEGIFSSDLQWICRGGQKCTSKNRLLGKEVMLSSVQFLGLAAAVANSLATSPSTPDREAKQFIAQTVQVLTSHLLRWGDDNEIDRIQTSIAVRAEQITGPASRHLFTDKHLWLIAIYSEMAGILKTRERWMLDEEEISRRTFQRLQRHFSSLLQFFSSRVAVRKDMSARSSGKELAYLDRGYWRFYPDSRYAGYERPEKPAACVPGLPAMTPETDVHVSSQAIPLRGDIGWDISHARRLVQALDALSRNRRAITQTFDIPSARLPAASLEAQFAATLVATMWNGDSGQPLFANYWGGANGWYRVAWDDGSSRCREGTPPYGLTESFANGGYIVWSRHEPAIGALGRRLYDLSRLPDGGGARFLSAHYPSLATQTGERRGIIGRLMFLPSLVQSKP